MGCPPPLPRLGLAGLGPWGRHHARVLARLGVLHAICDPAPETLEQAARKHPSARPYEQLEAMLGDPDLDAIVLATPPRLHARQAIEVLRSGRSVLVEKPLALTAAEAERVAEEAERRGLVLRVGHLLLHHPAFETLKKALDEGTLGRLAWVEARRTNFGRFRDVEDALWNLAVHDVALLVELLGSTPVEVRCDGLRALGTPRIDEALLSLRFPSGLVARIHASWLHPVRTRRLTLVGQQGQIVFDDTLPAQRKLLLHRHTVRWREGHRPEAARGDTVALALPDREPLEAQANAFLEALQGNRLGRGDGAHAVTVTRILEAAQRSLQEDGRPVAPSATPPAPPSQQSMPFVHPSAHVDPGARLGPGTRVWHGAHVCSGAHVGEACVLGQNVYVGPGVRIGDRCRLQNDVSVFEGVELERGVFCGPGATFTNVSRPRALFPRRDAFERTLVREGASLGANSTIVCGVTVGRHALVGAGAVVTRDVPDHALVVGVPARRIGWVCTCGERLEEEASNHWRCTRCGRRYRPASRDAEAGLRPAGPPPPQNSRSGT